MRVVDGNLIDFRQAGTRHREGDIRFKHLLRGEQGSPQNYEFMIARTGAGFPSPAHRHNFDQIRYGLYGTFGDGKGLDVGVGQCGYYPEGTPYSIDSRESEVILLQFGGASGWGFTHFPQLAKAYSELSQVGEFREGRFYRAHQVDEPTPKMQDGYEALWQHIHGRPVVYPLPRYGRPVIMDPNAYAWRPITEGVHRKILGAFTERSLEVGLLKLARSSSWALSESAAPTLLYVLEGTGTVGLTDVRAGAAAEILPSEKPALASRDGLLLFYVVLPIFDASEVGMPAGASAHDRIPPQAPPSPA